MIGQTGWLELTVVAVMVLGLLTLMLFISARQRGRGAHEIVKTTVLVWAAVAITLTVAWLLEGRVGGPIFDLRVGPEPEVLTRPVTTSEAVALGAVLVVMLGLYVATIIAVRRLLGSSGDDVVNSKERPGDDDS